MGIIGSVLVCLASCKKYPENDLWFKNPYDFPVVHGNIVDYRVNGIDSLDLLNLYYDTVRINDRYPYNKTSRDIRQESFSPTKRAKVSYDISCDLFSDGIGHLEWENDKKRVVIYFSGSDYRYYKKNIFIENNTVWEVVKLEKDGLSKIKNTFNGNVYEITFK